MTTGATQLTRDLQLDERLRSALEQASLEHPGVVTSTSASLFDLACGRGGQWRADADIYPASVVKVPVMAEVFHRYAEGTLRPGDRVVVDAANQTATSGPAPFIAGYQASVDELVTLMIAHSDNVATNQLIDVLRREQVTQYMRDLGLQSFVLGRKLSGSEPLINDPDEIGRNRLPVAEISRLLMLIANDKVPGSEQQRRILRTCVDDAKLVPGLRAGDVFMHKTGETSTVSHDAGILETPAGRRYIVGLYCEVEPTPDRADASHANPFMAHWMRIVREDL